MVNPSLVWLNVFLFILVVIFNGLSGVGVNGLFPRTQATVSNGATVDFTPAGWAFITWGVIYVWQALWLLFNVIILFRYTSYGPVYSNPPVLDDLFHSFITLNFLSNITWLFLFANLQYWASYAFLLIITLSLYGALVISHKNIYDAEIPLNIYPTYLFWYRLLVNNGLAYYATWVTIASCLNFSIALCYASGVSRNAASIVGISILLSAIIVYIFLDIYFYENYLRFTYSPYLQLLYALAGILAQNSDLTNATAIIAVIAIITSGVFFIVKVINSINNILIENV